MTPGAGHGATPEQGQGHLGDAPAARAQLRKTDTWTHGHWGREHVTDTDTSMGHVTCVTAGYLYQPRMKNGISPEPELYKCNTIPILVNIAKIVLTSWISSLSNIVSI